MKSNSQLLSGSTAAIVAVLLFVFRANAQDPFSVKWTMDYTQAGVSSHINFSPSSAVLAGGANTFTLPTVYSTGGAIVAGYIIRPWPTIFSPSRYMEFTFSASSLKYNITSIGFRLRRSPNGPNGVKVRTSMDGFAADLNAFVISNNGVFNSYSIPVSYIDLSSNTFTLRIYAYNPVDIYGTLWFDEISVNGDVQAIILPVDLTYFKGSAENGQIALNWETAWEKNSKQFVIERASDAKSFTVIDSVAASAETTGRTSYSSIDRAPLPGNNYYRLKFVDQDGAFTISKPISVSNVPHLLEIRMAPNPASPRSIDILAPYAGNVTFELHTASGAPVLFNREDDAGGHIRLIPLRPLASGIYFVSYIRNGRKEHLKVLVP
ncbi:T9SS type A sorting domain-containing protein [Dyadobacter sp. CY261]|uniref:T9SS type A sorting domain-containing protein n=1 Tax=Dyadobacter sp. CY261 TaxID=2907203 RepID=UPI001F173746|nr:T9SS type A sorting domain-containing protein [Dyadobacter sp. CY261]MCF0072208.1 T9SS type A sorting domain-containing protein [Dyadobacter sp. CY261]